MTAKNKNKLNTDFSHIETEKLRATFIENPEKAKEIQKKFESSNSIMIRIGEYLRTDDPLLKDCEIALMDFVPVLNHAKDHVLYIKVKPQDKTVIYHLTPHPDTYKALHDLSLDARKKGFAIVDSKVHILQAADMLKKKLSGTLMMKPGRHPNMDYLEK